MRNDIENTMIADKFGGKKAFLAYCYYQALYRLGVYKQYTDLDWQNVNRLVFICMGNINRSPYAEYKAKALGLDSISYGIDADETKGASSDAIRNANTRNIDLSSHHCKSIYNMKLEPGDLILGVEPVHLSKIHMILDNSTSPISLIGLWSQTPTPYIQDPICRSDAYYQSCFSTIDSALERIRLNLAI